MKNMENKFNMRILSNFMTFVSNYLCSQLTSPPPHTVKRLYYSEAVKPVKTILLQSFQDSTLKPKETLSSARNETYFSNKCFSSNIYCVSSMLLDSVVSFTCTHIRRSASGRLIALLRLVHSRESPSAERPVF